MHAQLARPLKVWGRMDQLNKTPERQVDQSIELHVYKHTSAYVDAKPKRWTYAHIHASIDGQADRSVNPQTDGQSDPCNGRYVGSFAPWVDRRINACPNSEATKSLGPDRPTEQNTRKTGRSADRATRI